MRLAPTNPTPIFCPAVMVLRRALGKQRVVYYRTDGTNTRIYDVRARQGGGQQVCVYGADVDPFKWIDVNHNWKFFEV